jgi:hypothetical protein
LKLFLFGSPDVLLDDRILEISQVSPKSLMDLGMVLSGQVFFKDRVLEKGHKYFRIKKAFKLIDC